MQKRKSIKRKIQAKKKPFYTDLSFYLAISLVILFVTMAVYTASSKAPEQAINTFLTGEDNDIERISADMDNVDVDELDLQTDKFDVLY
jgi:Tfp pilus assembly protein PilN